MKKELSFNQEYFSLEASVPIQRRAEYMPRENLLPWAAILAFVSMGSPSVPISRVTITNQHLNLKGETAASLKMVRWSKMAILSKLTATNAPVTMVLYTAQKWLVLQILKSIVRDLLVDVVLAKFGKPLIMVALVAGLAKRMDVNALKPIRALAAPVPALRNFSL